MSVEIDFGNFDLSESHTRRYYIDPTMIQKTARMNNDTYPSMNFHKTWLMALLYRSVLKQRVACKIDFVDRSKRKWKGQSYSVPQELHKISWDLWYYIRKGDGPGGILNFCLPNALWEMKQSGFVSYNEHYEYLKKELIELEKLLVKN